MRILSLDASTKSSGYAIFDGKTLESYGCITSSSTDLIKRIAKMVISLKEIFETKDIDKIIIEEVRQDFVNIKTYKALMYLQAAIAFLAHDYNINIEFIYPGTWRSKCGIKTGRGIKREELKKADIAFVKATYGIDVNDDIADAVSIAHAYVTVPAEINWE